MTINKEVKKNCTSIFLAPALGIGKERLLKNGYISGYLGDVQRPELTYERGVWLLFKPKAFASFEDFLHEERDRGANIMEDYDYDGYVVVVYVIDKEYEKDFNRFLEGKYSKYSPKFKALFPQTVKKKNAYGIEKEEPSLQSRVFTRDKALQEYWRNKLQADIPDDLELYSSPDIGSGGEEYLDITQFKEEEVDDV